MKTRCSESCRGHSRKDYYERGIRVCKEWNDSYVSFKSWALQNGYSDSMSIERVDVNGNYEPQNCTFVELKEQPKNRRNTLLTVDGVTKTKEAWSKEVGVSKSTFSSRLNKLGWTAEKAVSTPVRKIKRGVADG